MGFRLYMVEIRSIIFFCLFFLSMQALLAVSPQARPYLRQAKAFLAKGNLQRAQNLLQRAKRYDPDSDEIKEFEIELNKAVDEKIRELKQLTDFYLNSKNLPEAQKAVQQLLIIAPDDEYGKSKSAEINEINDKIQEYRNKGIVVDVSTGRSHDIDLYSAISYLNRARGFLANGDRKKALEMIEKVLEREPLNKEALNIKEKILYIDKVEDFIENAEKAFAEGKMQECVIALDRLIEESPSRHEYLLLRAKALIKIKEYDRAEEDLWKYYRYNPETDQVFHLFAELYFATKKYDLAMGMAREAAKDPNYSYTSLIVKSYLFHYANHFIILAVFLCLWPFTFYYFWLRYDELRERLPPGGIKRGISLVVAMFFSSPEFYLPQLVDYARQLNIAWLNYFAGICLFRAGQIEGAQRFLAYSLNNDFIAGRAYYFVGLTRKILKHNMFNHDFEESVLSSLGHTGKGWYPDFVRQVEYDLLKKYGTIKDESTFEGMAYQLVADQTGEK